ncbi:MAG: AMP-binding protein [Bacteroidia bacterium]|nr:AMP-binding protein [Bacteroidia bacterium]NNK72272.1 AMP-binding protein [Flavobacteriaceae bacterium]
MQFKRTNNQPSVPTFDKVHFRFKLDGIHYSHEDLKEVGYSLVKEGDPYEIQVGEFMLNWLDDHDYIDLKTSGSTGDPKTIRLRKQVMVNSAINTGDFFNLEPGDRGLLCLPARFIAGKMMLVRAMILGLELDTAEPSSHVLFSDQHPYDLCAMAPIQLKNALSRLDCFKRVIVGGSRVPDSLVEAVQDKSTDVYETYGMTETASHVAVKRLNHRTKDSDAYFQCLAGNKIVVDDRGCLVIHSNHLSDDPIITNDVVKLHSDTQFEWLGRIDNVINSGGVKLHPESIERKLSSKIEPRFFITSLPDEDLGERVILVVEAETNELSENAFDGLDKYEIPKEIFAIPKFAETETHKVSRERTLALIK